ncbi:MAG: hypothetical protein WCA27_11320 [Candidatus Sulfotelmatobacter sp.]
MTYIAAFECVEGIVMCADTQETHEAGRGYADEKEYVEKLYVPENLSFPIAVGGAGLDEPIEALSLELFERVEKKPPVSVADLRAVIQAAINEVHKSDAKVSAWPQMYRTTRCIVAAKPLNEQFAIFTLTGQRVSYRKREPVIIGYDTPANKALLTRLYRPGLTMQQAVMLAIYLLSQSKTRDVGVGGDPRIAVVTVAGASIDDPEYVTNSEQRILEFINLMDELFLQCIDSSTPPSVFPEVIELFQKSVTALRSRYFNETATMVVRRMFSEPPVKAEPYQKAFAGAMLTVMADLNVEVKEQTKEETEQFRQNREWAEQQKEEWRLAQARLEALIEGRKPLYAGRERVLLRPKRPIENTIIQVL